MSREKSTSSHRADIVDIDHSVIVTATVHIIRENEKAGLYGMS
jgi:hypothetical protein